MLQAIQLFVTFLQGLAYLHEKSLMHRDIKVLYKRKQGVPTVLAERLWDTFFSLFWYGICCKLAFQTHKHSLNSYRLLCPAMRRTRHSHSESLIPLHTSPSSEYLSFFSTTIIIQWNKEICLPLSLANTAL